MSRPRSEGHVFAGKLVEKHTGDLHGMHQTQLRLEDADGGSHIVYVAHGRGAVAAFNAERLAHSLEIGQHYFGRATICRAGDLHTYWMGKVWALALDRRGKPLQAARRGAARRASGAAA